MCGQDSCYFFKFGLLVTGETEEEHISKLFKPLAALGICSFEVIRRLDQRSPVTSPKRQLKMVGNGKIIPDKDAQDIGFPARNYLAQNPCSYVILIDDLEHDRRGIAAQIFDRYRQALDIILLSNKARASVHFLVNMLEAYYFANASAINSVLGTSLSDYEGDVETIRHPKNDLKGISSGFDEKYHGGQILDCLDVTHALSRPDTCSSLRTLFLWCLNALKKSPVFTSIEPNISQNYCLVDGILCKITLYQIP
ncbi:MAG: hypothetical protein AAF921_13380 [Cyanobacteria bacterium P01_D01_bin.44]